MYAIQCLWSAEVGTFQEVSDGEKTNVATSNEQKGPQGVTVIPWEWVAWRNAGHRGRHPQIKFAGRI
ncbi:hypothetical protein CS8_048040 [Cupriavidus sp. 8B]